MRTRILGAVSVCLLQAAFGQEADKSLTFEVASIKPAAPIVPDASGRIFFAGPTGGPGTTDPTRIRYPNSNLRLLLTVAFDMKNFQIFGPDTIDTERFDLTATLAPGATKEQFRIMMQNLLAERFKLTFHRESREMPTYSLIVTKGGPKMKESAPSAPPADAGPPSAQPGPPPAFPKSPTIGTDGFPNLPFPPGPRLGMIMMNGRAKMTAQEQTMQDFATRLSSQLNKPVTDNTGLTAKYDFTLIYLPEALNGPSGPIPVNLAPPPPPLGAAGIPNPTNSDEPLPTLVSAVQQQLGLKLDPKKAPVGVIVVDHVEKTPTDN